MAISGIRRFLDFLAKLGLFMRDDPPKVVDLSVREWGAVVDGLALSIRQTPDQDPDAQPGISFVLRNAGEIPRTLTVPGWLYFYHIEITSIDGAPTPMTPFGRELLRPERQTERIGISLAPGEATETLIPVGSIFNLRAKGGYRLDAWCDLQGGNVLRSNAITI